MMKRATRWRGWLPVGLALCAAGWGNRLAAEPRGTEAAAEARASFQERRERLRHQMNVELEAMVRICGLDQKQRQRLEVAARGVVEQVLEERDKVPDPNKPGEWRWDEEGLSAAKADLLEHPLWSSTVNEVLRKDQTAALEQERRTAKQHQRDAAIRFASGLLQIELRLKAEQRDQMANLLQKTMPDSFCEPELDPGAYTHWLDPLDVEKILTKTQFAYWLDLQRTHAGGVGERLLGR